MKISGAPDLFRSLCERLQVDAKLEVVDSSDHGAWTDGTTVWVTAATLARLSEAEVGAVLGHELGHIKLNHLPSSARAVHDLRSSLYSSSPSGVAGLVAAVVIEAALATATAERSRNLELQADQVGNAVARAVGCPKGSMSSALRSIAGEHETTRLLDTHPSTPRRVERLESSKGPQLCIRIVRRKR